MISFLRFKFAISLVVSAAIPAFAETPPTLAEETLNHVAVGLSQRLSGMVENIGPQKGECKSSTTPAEPIKTAEKEAANKGQIGIYSCEMEQHTLPLAESPAIPEPSPTPGLKKRAYFDAVPGRTTIDFYNTNDQMFLGLTEVAFDRVYGNDLGRTFDVGFVTTHVLAEDSEIGKKGDVLGVEINTQLYTAKTKHSMKTYSAISDGVLKQQLTGVAAEEGDHPIWYNSVGYKGSNFGLDQQFLNVVQAKAFKDWNRDTYFVKGVVALEKRVTEGTPSGVAIQAKWHDITGSYHWNTFSDAGRPGVVKRTPGAKTKPSKLYPDGVDSEALTVTSDILPNDKFAKFGKWASTVSGAVGKRADFFQGRCRLEAMVSADLVAQGGGPGGLKIDENTNVMVSGIVKAGLFKNHLLDLQAGSSVMYFPDRTNPEVTKVAPAGAVSVQTVFPATKNGGRFAMAIQMEGNGGKGRYNELDDKNLVMRVVLSHVFAGEGDTQKPPRKRER